MHELKTQLRPAKIKINELRKQNFVPAVLYGPKIKNQVLMVDKKALNKIYKEVGESLLFKVVVEDQAKKSEKENLVLIYDLARDPINDEIIHVDFYQPRLDKAIKTQVPLIFVGQAPAVTLLSGVLIKNIHEVEVEALPQNLPREIEINISSLKEFEDRICVKDLVLKEGIKINLDPEEIIALVEPPRTEEELKALEEKPEATIEDVKTEVEEKRQVEAEKATDEELSGDSTDKTEK